MSAPEHDLATPGEMPLPFVSYAQNAEDVLLWRALHDIDGGFYVDVGANDPERDSVTCAFYQRGWSGINIEPVAAYFERLRRDRPRDVNLRIAAGAAAGERDFFEVPDTGLSTLDAVVASRHRAAGRPVVQTRIAARPLRDVLAEHAAGDIHFLKIDVEGAEADVLAGADLRKQRPWIIVVESTSPLTRLATYEEWEPALLACGYRFAHSDGLNRFYVAEERAALASRLVTPLAETTEFIRAAEVVARAEDRPAAARFDASQMRFLGLDDPPPTLARPVSQLCTEAQFREPVYRAWCEALGETPMFHRKQWEHVYALEVLQQAGMLVPGKRGLGFGCGVEPLPALLAMRGCTIVATDLPGDAAAAAGWAASNQHASALEQLNDRGLCDPELFAERVSLRSEDMNRISAELTGFDFVWSSCAFEHLGSLEKGLSFVVNAMRCLKPGGIAVHTTEFNLSSNLSTIQSPDLVVYRRHDIEGLMRTLTQAGYEVLPLNLNPGGGALDRYVDLPPYRHEPHLRLKLDRFVLTSIGLAVRRVR